jgi:hypothetical protein
MTRVDEILPVLYDFEEARRAVRPDASPSG